MGRYSRQFREEAIKLVTEEGYKPAEAARKLGIPHSTFEKWMKNIGWPKSQAGASAASEDPKVLAIQVRELQAQVRRLEMEKEILKKATAFFASQNL